MAVPRSKLQEHAPAYAAQSQIQVVFERAVNDRMRELLRKGYDPDVARSISKFEVHRTLENALLYGRSVSLRPVIVLDWAQLRGETSMHAVSIGGGLRMVTPASGGEFLVVGNTGGDGPGTPRPSAALIVRFRVSPGALFGHS